MEESNCKSVPYSLEVAGASRFGLWSSLTPQMSPVKSVFLLEPQSAPKAVRSLALPLGPHLQAQK